MFRKMSFKNFSWFEAILLHIKNGTFDENSRIRKTSTGWNRKLLKKITFGPHMHVCVGISHDRMNVWQITRQLGSRYCSKTNKINE